MSFTKFPLILLVLTVLTCFSIPIFTHAHSVPSMAAGHTAHATTGSGITAYKNTFDHANEEIKKLEGNHFHIVVGDSSQVLAFRLEDSTYVQAPAATYYVSNLEVRSVSSITVEVTGNVNYDGTDENVPVGSAPVTFEIVGSTNTTQNVFTNEEGQVTVTLPTGIGVYVVTAKVLDIDEITFTVLSLSTSNTLNTLNSRSRSVSPRNEGGNNEGSNIDNNDLLLAIAMNFGENPKGDLARYDVDSDGDIDIDDFLLVQAQLGQNGNPGAPAASHTLSDTLVHIKGLNITNPELQ